MKKIEESTLADFVEAVESIGAKVITEDNKLAKMSKDFYWYSPVLKRLLEDKIADIAVRPKTIDELKKVVGFAAKYSLPIVIRGGATGNYGQVIPIHGGLVIDTNALTKFEITEDGVVRGEPGARIGAIEKEARMKGWEMRCIPSTFVISSLAGFLSGGSGGIGSITYGGITSNDNVKSLTLLTAEPEPKIIKLEESDCLTALHTYGTTGIVIEVEMRLGPVVPYEELIIMHEDWDTLLDWTDGIARDDSITKRLVTMFQKEIPPYFTAIEKHIGENPGHTTFLIVDKAQSEDIIKSAESIGAVIKYRNVLPNPLKPPYITDYTWNHTTLMALKVDPNITYLQVGFANHFREQVKMLWEKFPGEILFHFEWVKSNSKMEDKSFEQRKLEGSNVVVGSIPLIHFKSEERLQEIIDYSNEIGVPVANPHTYVLEEGGTHPDIDEKVALRDKVDPQGLLNPGKMKSARCNPFAA